MIAKIKAIPPIQKLLLLAVAIPLGVVFCFGGFAYAATGTGTAIYPNFATTADNINFTGYNTAAGNTYCSVEVYGPDNGRLSSAGGGGLTASWCNFNQSIQSYFGGASFSTTGTYTVVTFGGTDSTTEATNRDGSHCGAGTTLANCRSTNSHYGSISYGENTFCLGPTPSLADCPNTITITNTVTVNTTSTVFTNTTTTEAMALLRLHDDATVGYDALLYFFMVLVYIATFAGGYWIGMHAI